MRAVLERDLLAAISRPRAFALRVLPALAVAAALAAGTVLGGATLAAAPDLFGRFLLSWGGGVLVVVLLLLTPPVVLDGILPERLRGTLPLILVTPVGAGRFVLAKFLARAGCVAGWALATAPPLAVALWFGGVRWTDLLHLGMVVAAIVVESAAWTILVSCHARRTATGLVLAYVLPWARWWATAAVAGALTGLPFTRARFASGFDTTPLSSLVAVVSPGAFARILEAQVAAPGLAGFLRTHPAIPCLVVSLLIAVLALAVSARRLSQDGGEREPEWIRVQSRWLVRLLGGMPRFSNPVAWKETRLLNSSSSPPLYYGVLGLLLALEASLLFAPGRTPWQAHVGLLTVEIVVVAFVSMVNGVATIGHEKAQGTLDLLLASPLPPERVFRGKLAGVTAGILLLALVPGVHALVGLFTGALRPMTAVIALFLLAALVRGAGCYGLRRGVLDPGTRTAVVRAALVFALISVAPPVLWTAFEAGGRSLPGSSGGYLLVAGRAVLGLSPPVLCWSVLESAEVLQGRPAVGALFTDPLTLTWGLIGAAFLLRYAVQQTETLPRLLRHRCEWEAADTTYRFDRVMDRVRARIDIGGRNRWKRHEALRRMVRERRAAAAAARVERRRRARFRRILEKRRREGQGIGSR